MELSSMTDKAIAAELGDRLRALRLRRNMTQQQLAEASVLSLNTIKALEAGNGKLASIIAVLRELDALASLEAFLPAPSVSPLQLAKRQGKKRQRASGGHKKKFPGEDLDW